MPQTRETDRAAGSARAGSATGPVYSAPARAMHWLTVAVLLAQVPVGIVMKMRGDANIWDATTNTLYSTHKLVGILLLVLVAARLVYRLSHGAPPDEPTIEPWQRAASHVTHWTLYALLIVVPLLGWLGVSRYPALDIFGLFKLPALAAPDQAAAARLFALHAYAAFALIGLAGVHIAAALYHRIVRKDGVLARMLPPRR